MSDDHPSSTDLAEERPQSLVERLKRLFGGKSEGTLRESLEEVLVEHAEGPENIGHEERTLLLNTLAFAEARVDDIMVPRVDIVAVESTSSLDEVAAAFVAAAVSRMPIYRESLDDVVAMVHVKDVFRILASGETAFKLADVQRPILFVPPSMRLPNLLVKMRATRIHMAVVVDEYGGTDGIVTIEDLVEQIVGDIEDEHDIDEDVKLTTVDSQTFESGARLDLDVLEEALGQSLRGGEEFEDVDTVGGLVTSLAGRVPKAGESFIHAASGVRFEVLEADPRRLRRVRVHLPVLDADG